MDAPGVGEVEVCLLGPGFGESCVVHLGDGKWVIVDSCIDRDTRQPAPLEYLKSIGVPLSAVELIIVTHWHDDHVRGLTQVVQECTEARVCLSSAFRNQEFLNFVSVYSRSRNAVTTSGVDEIGGTIRAIIETGRKPVPVTAAKCLLQRNSLVGSNDIAVWGLSPSDAQFGLAMAQIAAQIPGVMQPKNRVPEPDQNDLSIAVWIRIGEVAVLLGADLEESGNPDLGWSAVLNNPGRPPGKAILFKIPHHGSANGHHEGVWAEMLESEPTTMLTPWNRGSGLPRDTDVDRILQYAPQSFTTAKLPAGKFRKPRIRAVEKTMAEVAKNITATLSAVGRIRARFTPPNTNITVDLAGQATHLSEYVYAPGD